MKDEELVRYVLERVPVHVFNAATKSFSTQALYNYVRRDLVANWSVFDGSQLSFAVKMADAFRTYHIYQVDGEYPDTYRNNMDRMRHKAMTFPTRHPLRQEYTEQYNAMVDTFNKALKPQNKLIKLYRKIQNEKLNGN